MVGKFVSRRSAATYLIVAVGDFIEFAIATVNEANPIG
jgi:hypothetical protein